MTTAKKNSKKSSSSNAGVGIDVQDLKVHYDTPDGVVKAVESILPQQFLQAAKELFTVFTTKEIVITDYYRTAKFGTLFIIEF